MDFVDEGYTTVDYTPLVDSYYQDLNYLVDLLARLCSSYNILVTSADLFNRNSFAKKDDVDNAVHRAKDLGKVIDKVIDYLEDQADVCIGYTRTKNEFIGSNLPFDDIIKSHVDHYVKVEHHKLHHDDDKNDNKSD